MTEADTWEQRMSDRAKKRLALEDEQRILEAAARGAILAAQAEDSVEEEIERRSREMSPEDAQEILDNPFACACTGALHPGWPCSCEMTRRVVLRVLERAEEQT